MRSERELRPRICLCTHSHQRGRERCLEKLPVLLEPHVCRKVRFFISRFLSTSRLVASSETEAWHETLPQAQHESSTVTVQTLQTNQFRLHLFCRMPFLRSKSLMVVPVAGEVLQCDTLEDLEALVRCDGSVFPCFMTLRCFVRSCFAVRRSLHEVFWQTEG